MAPIAPKQSIDPKLTIETFLSTKKKGVPVSSQERPEVIRARSQTTTKPVVSAVNPQQPIKVISPVQEIIKTPQQLMKPMSQEIKEPMPQQVRDNLIAGNVSPQSMQSKPEIPVKLSVVEFAQKIKTKYPQYDDMDDQELVDKMVTKYPTYLDMVDYDLGRIINPQNITRIEPQISYGENKIQPEKTLLGTIKGFGQDVAESYNKRASNIQEGQVRYSGGGVKNTALDIVNSLSQGMGAFQDIVGSGIGRTFEYGFSKLPEDVQRDMKERLEYDLKKPSVQAGLQALNQGMENYASWKQQNPDTAVVTDFVLNGVQTALDLAGWGVAAKGAKAGTKATIEAGEQAIKRIPGVAQDIAQGAKNIPSKVGSITSDIIGEGKANKMLTNMNRITKGEQEKFKVMAGETVGEFLNNRGITEGGDEAISKIANKFIESKTKADKGLEAIKGEFKDKYLSLMANEAADFAENTLSPDATKIRSLANKANTKGLTMAESNELKRFYESNNKFTYGKDITAGERTVRATNIDNAVRKRQFDIADQNGFSNLKQINKETQGYKYLLDKLVKNEAGRLGNNAMGLTDWIVAGQVAIDPSSIALLVGKKVAESNWFRSNVVKIINKLSGHKNKGDLTLDLGKIQGIQTEKDLNKYLALPLKENVTSPTLNTMNRADGNQGAIVGTNVAVSPKPKASSNTVIEKISTQSKIKPNTSIVPKSEGQLIKGVPELGTPKRPIITPQTFKQGVAQKTTIEKGVATKPGTTKDIVAKLDQQMRAKKQGETPVKTVVKSTETKIEPKKATTVSKEEKTPIKVKEKSIAKKENGSTIDGMKNKELQPLYEEAKKYKSADEFVNDNKVYHGTNQKFDDFDIELGGKATSSMPSAKGNIFFTKDKGEAIAYAKNANKSQIVDQKLFDKRTEETQKKIDNLQSKGKRDEADALTQKFEEEYYSKINILQSGKQKGPEIAMERYINPEKIKEINIGGQITAGDLMDKIDKTKKEGYLGAKLIGIIDAPIEFFPNNKGTTQFAIWDKKALIDKSQLRKIREEANK